MNILNYKFIAYQLTRPFSYLAIKHADKWIYDWLIPFCLALGTLGIAWLCIPVANLGGKDGLIADITNFIANLPGFFIAALAAVATFTSKDLDKTIPSSPTMNIHYQGHPLIVEITRRRFLCVLFSYLTASSIFIVIGAKIGIYVEVSNDYFIPFSWGGFLLFSFALWQMITATMLGLYYLGERLHTPNAS